MVFKLAQKFTNIKALIVRKFSGKNFEKWSNLVTLDQNHKMQKRFYHKCLQAIFGHPEECGQIGLL